MGFRMQGLYRLSVEVLAHRCNQNVGTDAADMPQAPEGGDMLMDEISIACGVAVGLTLIGRFVAISEPIERLRSSVRDVGHY